MVKAAGKRIARIWAKSKCTGRCPIVIGFTVSILVVGIGSFFLGVVFAHPVGFGRLDRAGAVIEEARKRVPPAALPPKPSGHTVTESKTVTITMPRPGLLGVDLPEIVRQVTVPTTKLVGATPEETAQWQAETDKLQHDYEQKLSLEAKKIANEMFVNDWRSTVALLTTFSKDVVIPFLAGVAGIIGAVVTLMKAFRTKPETST